MRCKVRAYTVVKLYASWCTWISHGCFHAFKCTQNWTAQLNRRETGFKNCNKMGRQVETTVIMLVRSRRVIKVILFLYTNSNLTIMAHIFSTSCRRPLVHLRPYNITNVWLPRYRLRIIYHYARLFEHTVLDPNVSALVVNATRGHGAILAVFNLALDSLFPAPRDLMAFNETVQENFREYLGKVLVPWVTNGTRTKVVWMDVPPTNPPYGNNGLNSEIHRYNQNWTPIGT